MTKTLRALEQAENDLLTNKICEAEYRFLTNRLRYLSQKAVFEDKQMEVCRKKIQKYS